MSYPYDRPGGQSGSGGQRGVGVPGGQWVPVPGSGGPGSGGPGSGGRRSSAGVVVGCVVGLVVAALVGGVAFVALRSGGSEPGSNPTASPTATARPTEQQTIASDHYWADVLGGKFHIESTSVVQGPTDQDGAGACQFFCVWGLEVGGDSVGVGGGELGEGLFPVGGGASLDEACGGCSFVGGFACGLRLVLLTLR